ncbi:cyclomaltodextrin glucanotransferase [Pseudoxanthomonas dokdonensis]|uniref:Cyclomaltodextrin glucanotransferase n=1 Tax=Pseudoxanthomonas dokdonensis TaxID=344882 RepID=A0A0R0CNR6_9GAMM|nr:alpha-amylase family glycosyl hydrolase [Pseudoxanthomonas dokdonensis]KRG71195.1 cyclomaltodextrin glucanotransferase [Pseudoxanthomonas dokdonensis]
MGAQASDGEAFYGTREAFASDAIYFVMTDRFVNGDPGNDQRDQGGDHPTFDRPVELKPGELANIGYLGGDFKGVLDNAGYIHDLGFNAVWITPIVDNPDQAFTGSKPIASGSIGTDQGKTGYHGYWGVNFYKLDEHLPSPGLDFAGFTRAMQAQDLKVVLDIVANHGSPAYSMPVAQPMFGQIYDADGKLVADHQNLRPGQLDPARQPLHRFYNTRPGLAELSDTNENNPDVLDYFVGAYEQWIDQGAAAFRVDTIRWMPHDFWKQFADRIRARHPDFFMFGENFDYDAATIAPHTWARNGHISVLDFPMKKAMAEVFESPGSDYARLAASLYLEDGPYANPYDLVTFYDNHDMARLNASDQGFIDANNWLFTARGIPALYYGSETGFMRGRGEHAGNRNYYGQQRIDDAARSPIYAPLKRIANLRRDNIALQRGLQLDVSLEGDQAVFYRVYQQDDQHQIALVLLNKGDASHRFEVEQWLQSGSWRDGFSGKRVQVDGKLQVEVPGHDVRVLLLDQAVTRPDLKQRLQQLMARKVPKAD